MPFREPDPPACAGEIVHPVVLRTFGALHEAEFARTQLAGHDVISRIDDAMTVGVSPWLGPALGGIRLLVSSEDEHRAREVLDALAEASDEADEARSDDERRGDEADATARRAVTAAVFGLVTIPVLAHLYSLYLIVGVDRAGLSGVGRRRVGLALVFNAGVFATVAWLIAR